MDTNASDESLVQIYCQTRDDRAFRILLERYHLRIEALVRSVLGSAGASDSQDVTQEIFVRVYRGLTGFRHEAQFSTWLYRTAYNHSLNHKLRTRRRTISVNDATLEQLASPGADPSSALERQQLRQQLDLALERLPTEYQMAMRLHYWQQMPIASIAQLMIIPENTVKSYLHRARKLLAHHLDHQKDSL